MRKNSQSKFLLFGAEPESLLNFRGKLIEAIKNKGYSVVTVSNPLSEDLTREFNREGIAHTPVTIKRSSLNPINDLKLCSSLYRLLKKECPDMMLAYTIKPVIWGGISARLAGVKFYAMVTGLGYTFQVKSFKRKLLHKVVIFLYKSSLRHAAKVIFQNEDDRLVFVTKGIVPFNKTEVVNGSGVDIEYFDKVDLPDLSHGVTFLCIARLLKAKGLREYAKAASIVKSQYPNARFLLVGPEDSSPDGISIDEVKSWTSIEYLGSARDIRPFIEQSHVYVLPSYHEGLPRSTIEAMSMGRPVLTTNAVGCKETVEEGINGFIVPTYDEEALSEKMIWFIKYPELIKPMGLFSRRMVEEKFDVNKINARMLKIMEL